MSADAPQAARNKLVVVVFVVLGVSPGGLLPIRDDFKEEGCSDKPDGSEVTDPQGGVERRGKSVAQVNGEADDTNPCS